MTTVTRAGGSSAGVAELTRFALWRERWILPWWLGGVAALLAVQSVSSARLYDDPGALARLRATMSANAAMVFMGGPERLLETLGGEIVFEVFAYLAVVVALMNMFLVCRNSRSDEESGRADLVRAARVGRRAPLSAALALAAFADLGVLVVVFLAAVGTGLPAGGALALAAALAAFGTVFAAATAVAAQIFESPRGVYGCVTALVAVAYLLRAVGDTGPAAAAWSSPIGWGQRMYPFVDNRWWPLALYAVATIVAVAAAFALLDRRDLGAGLIRPRRGRATASPRLRSPWALAWRLQRGSVLAWCAGAFVLGIAYGAFADSIEQFLADYPELRAYFAAGIEQAVNSYLALTMSIVALLGAAAGVASAVRARSEESSGRADPVLCAPVGGGRWFLGQAATALSAATITTGAGGLGLGLAAAVTMREADQIPRLLGVAAATLPAVWAIVAVAVGAVGLAPRRAAVVAWSAFAYVAVVAMFADAFDLPAWSVTASPFRHLAAVPLERFDLVGAALVSAVAAACVVAGVLGFRSRDLTA
ncbi:ABC transporter permease [Nocardia thailandica]